MLSIDSETCGKDFYHGSKPFFVTISYDDGKQEYYEWAVDPLTRQPKIPEGDTREIRAVLHRARSWERKGAEVAERHKLVLHNAKFDATALETIGVTGWPWSMTHDTLVASHILASNQPHNLTDLAMQYLGENIQPLEDALEVEVKKCRGIIQREQAKARKGKEHSDLAGWRIADVKRPLPELPSVRGSGNDKEDRHWKNDCWLPRALADYYGYEEDHPWYTVLREYANADSSITLLLWEALRQELQRRNRWKLYIDKMTIPPVLYAMEHRGLTGNRDRHSQIREDFGGESERCGRICVAVAESLGHDLVLPKSGNNKSLTSFCFETLGLVPVESGKKKKTAAPSLDKNALEQYEITLPPNSKSLTFIRNLKAKRSKDKVVEYANAYERFMLPVAGCNEHGGYWFVLHSSINQTGTDTTRSSSNNPNSQNVKKGKEGLRGIFGPLPGRCWYSLDYQNLELRLPAYECGERLLIDLFERPNDPPYYGSEHLLNFSVVYPDIWADAVQKVGLEKAGPWCKETYKASWYQYCKNGDFAVGYQAGDATADRAFHRAGSRAKLLARFAKKEALNQHWIRFAAKHGFVETMPNRTVDPEHGYPLLCTRTEYGKILPTIPLSYHVQGTAGEVKSRAMVKVHGHLEELNTFLDGPGYYLLMDIHDELVVDFPDTPEENLPIIREVSRLMSSIGDDLIPPVPLPTGIEYHSSNWAEGVTVC